MGHELARPTPATALILAVVALAACGGDDEETPPPVLDNVRELVAEQREHVVDAVDAPASSETVGPAELPLPDRSEYEGANRVVNLWVGVDGETHPIDVWGRRTFTTGPILLAENVEYGAASDYFGAPPGYSLSIVAAGAGPDGDELAALFNAVEGEQITTLFTNGDDQGAAAAPSVWEVDPTGALGAPAAPDPGTGVVYLFAPNTRAFGDALTVSVGSDAFYVGDGSGACHVQRVEHAGFQPNVLGGTQDVQVQLEPGPAVFTLHPWPSADECGAPSVLDVTVDVAADRTVTLLVYSPDGVRLEVLSLPMG